MIWFPGYGLTYGVMPVHLRMPTIAAVSFGYVCLLSFTRGAYNSDSDSATAVKMVEVVADVEGSSSSSSSSGAVTVAASVSAAEKHEQR